MGHDLQLRETESDRLDSWKEIASFLHRDARTVRRWERERGLPVHRVPGGERSGVFAYSRELQSWLHAAGPAAETVASELPLSNSETSLLPADETTSIANEPRESTSADSPAYSALHSPNSFETTFVADETLIRENPSPLPTPFVPHSSGSRGVALLAGTPSRLRQYQAVALLLLLTAAAGISAAVVHYREHRPVEVTAHNPSPAAQDLYLRGRYYWNLRTEEGLNCAVDLFTQSIVNDPKYAAAYAGLADSYLLLRQYGHMPNSEAFPRAFAAAQQAIALDDSSPEAHRSLAFILRFWNWDMAAAEKEYRRAIELNPNDSQSHHWYATALLSSGRTHEALTQIDLARSLEPQSVSVLADRGLILSLIDVHAGIAALQQVEQADPNFVSVHRYLSSAFLETGEYSTFLSESQRAADLSHDQTAVRIYSSAEKTLANRGPKPMLREIAQNWAPLADMGSFPAYDTALFFSLSGDGNRALHYLHLSRERRDPGFLNVENDAAFVALRSSPEYLMLIEHRDASSGGTKQPIAKLDAPELSE